MANQRFHTPLVAIILSLTFSFIQSKPYDVCKYSVSVCGSVLLNPTDRNILREFKTKVFSSNGIPLGDDWNASLTCAKGWSGVCTDKDGRVTEIALTYLDPRGVIPDSFGGLSKLLYLDLGYHSYFSSLPSNFGLLRNLQQLRLSSDNLQSLPPSMASLSNITHLYLRQCQLNESIIPIINRMTNLVHLDLSFNVITSLPSGAFDPLRKLINLYLTGNHMWYTPIPSLNTLISLENLDLSYNGFIGGIPSSFSSFKNLTTLMLSRNNLCGSIPSFYNVTRLLRFEVSDNFFTGSIPSQILNKFCGVNSYSFSGNCFNPPRPCNVYGRDPPICANGCNLIPGAAMDVALKFYPFVSLSSTYSYGDASLAIDGSSGSGKFYSRSCVHSQNQSNPFLSIVFSKVYQITTVQLYNRLDCCSDRLNGVRVYVGTSTVAYNSYGNIACTDPKFKFGPTMKGFPLNVTCNKSGNVVWVVVPGALKILHVCEVAVFVK